MARTKSARPKTNQTPGRFLGKTFALAGRFDQEQRQRVLQLVEGEGGQVVEDITSTLDFLVLGDPVAKKVAGQKEAEQLNKQGAAIRIISRADFWELFYPDRALAEMLLRSGPEGVKRWALLRGGWEPKLDLGDINLRGMNLTGISLRGVNLDGADLGQADLTNALLPEQLAGATLDGANLTSTTIRRLSDCSLRGVKASAWLQEAILERTDWTGADLSCASGFNLVARESTFREANLSRANLYDTKLRQSDFTGASLVETRLVKADLSGSTFTGANLHGADLSNAKLKGADLRNADLSEADLFEADLRQAQIEGANFEGAHLGGASLGDLDCTRARGFDPTKVKGPGRVGPNIKKLVEAAGQASELWTSINVDLPDGGEAHLTLHVSDHGKTIWTHRQTVGGHADHGRARTIAEGLLALPRRWPQVEPLPDTVRASQDSTRRGTKELRELALAAWCEACGVPIPTAEQVKEQVKTRKERKQALHQQLLAELRGGRRGVGLWNKRPLPLRRGAGSYQKIDLSGARLEGADLSNLDFAGAVFDGATLRKANLQNTVVTNARFHNADLNGVSLTFRCEGADFTGASLRDSRLTYGFFRKANFQNADLTGADLGGTQLDFVNLAGANLSGARLSYPRLRQARFDEHTVFPAGFVPPKEMEWVGAGPDPRIPKVPGVEANAGGEGRDAFLGRLRQMVDPARLSKALAMLKAERFQLYSQVDAGAVVGVVKSQTNADTVYSCRLAADGGYYCCTQNLATCGGLKGALCKHLLVLLVGLTRAEKLNSTSVHQWVAASTSKKQALDKDAASEVLLRYKGAEAGEIDWRPTETIPEDFYAL